MYPLGLELSVEATYPVDESIGTALIFMSGQIQGGLLVVASQFLEQDLQGEDRLKQVCSDSDNPDSETMGKDHTRFLMLIAGYLTLLVVIFITAFTTKMNRTMANQSESEELQSQNSKG